MSVITGNIKVAKLQCPNSVSYLYLNNKYVCYLHSHNKLYNIHITYINYTLYIYML